MYKFTYNSPYGSYPDCYFRTSRYLDNNNLAIEIWNNELGPVCKVTVNTEIDLPDNQIAVKDYSENEGMVDWLYNQGFLGALVGVIESGWVKIPVYEITETMRQYL